MSNVKKIVSLLLLLNVAINCFAKSEQDSLALVALYNSTGGPNWTNKTNWLSSEPISNWYGVIVSHNRVTWVDLHGNNLVGKLPLDIGKLANLEILKLGGNLLTGSIPSEISNLTNLTYLA